MIRIHKLALVAFGVVLCLFWSSPGQAQQSHITDEAALQGLIDQHLAQETSDREAIRALLDRPEVSDLAAGAGLDLSAARAAVGILEGDELSEVAGRARSVNESLAGGQNITITATTLIIILLLVLLIVVAAK